MWLDLQFAAAGLATDRDFEVPALVFADFDPDAIVVILQKCPPVLLPIHTASSNTGQFLFYGGGVRERRIYGVCDMLSLFMAL